MNLSAVSEFFGALKADLLDRRLLPLVILAAAVLAAAIGYAVLGGGSSAPATAVAPPSISAATGSAASIAVTPTTPEKAVAEVTSGSSEQRHGVARNPFTPLPEARKAVVLSRAAASSSTGTSSTPAASGSAGSSSAAAGSTPAKSEPSGASTEKSGGSTPAPAPAKPKTVYHVAVLFGVIPTGVTPQGAALTPYENVKLLSPLPSAKQPLLVFRGVTAGGKSATFTLVSEAILHGTGRCLPSASQCQAIDLAPGQTEQLEYVSPTGEASVYELRIVSIVSSRASTSAVKGLLRGESKAGRQLLRRSGLTSIPLLSDSSQVGILVFSPHGAGLARAHAAARLSRW